MKLLILLSGVPPIPPFLNWIYIAILTLCVVALLLIKNWKGIHVIAGFCFLAIGTHTLINENLIGAYAIGCITFWALLGMYRSSKNKKSTSSPAE